MRVFLGYIILSSLVLVSCNFVNGDSSADAVARVGDQYLYQSEIDELIADKNIEDSGTIVQAYVDNWIKEQLVLQKAQQNLTEKQLDFEQQLEDYRNSLIIYAYENQLIKQKLDTNVSGKEIKEYYNKNKSNFDLKEQAYKARFIKLLNSAPNQDSLVFWFFNKDIEFESKLREYCTQFATNCQLDTSNWILKNAWNDILPSDNSGNVYDIQMGENRVSDSLTTVLIDVTEIKKRGETAPIKYVEKQIRSIILNQRRLKLISNVKQEIYEDATLKKKYELYE